MKKQSIRIVTRIIPVLAAMLFAVTMLLPVQAAPDTAFGYEAIFDSTYYAEHNPDLQAAFGNDSNALLNHFIGYGMAEGRQGNAEFDVRYYKEQYPDLQAAFGENLTAYYVHYMNCGKAEGRVGSGEASDIPFGTDDSAAGGQTVVPEEAGATGYAYEVLELVNQARAANGLGSLTTTPQLMSTAQLRAVETATLFSHTRPDGTSCFTAFQQNGVTYRMAGENIAAGQRTPQSVMDSWMNSPGHRANILKADFNHIGIGCYQMDGGYGIYWVQCFTN